MGVDKQGYLKQIPQKAWTAEYADVLSDVCTQLTVSLPDLIHSVYVYGSVARGTAKPGCSDLDLTLVLHHSATEAEQQVLKNIQQAIQEAHSIVSKVDFDIGVLVEVLAPESALKWGCWLKHYCCHLMGVDLSLSFPLCRPSKALAMALNGDCLERLNHYVEQISIEECHVQLKRLQREASRLLLRGTMVLRTDADLDWPQSLLDFVTTAQKRYPEQALVWAFFLTQTQDAVASKSVFLSQLNAYLDWLAKVMSESESP